MPWAKLTTLRADHPTFWVTFMSAVEILKTVPCFETSIVLTVLLPSDSQYLLRKERTNASLMREGRGRCGKKSECFINLLMAFLIHHVILTRWLSANEGETWWTPGFTYTRRNSTAEDYLHWALQYLKYSIASWPLLIHHMLEEPSRIPIFSTEPPKWNSTHGKKYLRCNREKNLPSFQF